MGRTLDEFNCKGLVTDAERDELKQKIWALVESDIGRHMAVSGLDPLLEHIAEAINPVIINLESDDNGPVHAGSYNDLEKLIKKRVKALIKAADNLAVLMPDDYEQPGFDQLVAQYPWLHEIAQFDGVVRDNWQCKPNNNDDPAAVLRNAVAGLHSLSKIRSGAKTGRKSNDGAARRVVRAVCHFCDNLPWGLELTWPSETGEAANAGKRGGTMATLKDEQLGLPTRTAVILDAVFTALDWNLPRHQLRTHLFQYAGILRARTDRSTCRADFRYDWICEATAES